MIQSASIYLNLLSMNELFTAIFHQPIFNLLVVFYRLFGENLGLAIIAIALLTRVILLPLAIKQMSMMKQNQEFSKKVKEIKEKYKNDKQKQQEETMKLQSEFLPSQIAGCLPLIVQFVLLITINNVFHQLLESTTIAAAFNKFAYPFVPTFSESYQLNTNLFGIVDFFTTTPQKIAGESGFLSTAMLPFLILILLVGITQYFSAKVVQPKKIEETEKEKETKKKKKEENPTEDFAETLQKTTQQTMFLLPIMIMAASLGFPAGLSVYWVAQSTFVIVQQILLNRFRKTDKPVSK